MKLNQQYHLILLRDLPTNQRRGNKYACFVLRLFRHDLRSDHLGFRLELLAMQCYEHQQRK